MLKRILMRCLVTITCIGLWLTLGLVAEAKPTTDRVETSRPVRCAAALEIMAIAAPDWSAQPGVKDSWSAWLRQARVDSGDIALAAIDAEISILAGWGARKPDAFALMAADCAAEHAVNRF